MNLGEIDLAQWRQLGRGEFHGLTGAAEIQAIDRGHVEWGSVSHHGQDGAGKQG